MSGTITKEKSSNIKKLKKNALKRKIDELEQVIRYNEAMLEEIYETQESIFPIFVDLVKLISRLYKEMKIEDDELRNCMVRLKETFADENENILKKYYRDNEDFSIAYT